MPKTRGTGLLMLWTDVDAEHEAEFNRWYNEEHLLHLLKVPGFLSAGRYEALSGGPKYLAMYELEDVRGRAELALIDERLHPVPDAGEFTEGIGEAIEPLARKNPHSKATRIKTHPSTDMGSAFTPRLNHWDVAGVAVRENGVSSQSTPIYDTFASVARSEFCPCGLALKISVDEKFADKSTG